MSVRPAPSASFPPTTKRLSPDNSVSPQEVSPRKAVPETTPVLRPRRIIPLVPNVGSKCPVVSTGRLQCRYPAQRPHSLSDRARQVCDHDLSSGLYHHASCDLRCLSANSHVDCGDSLLSKRGIQLTGRAETRHCHMAIPVEGDKSYSVVRTVFGSDYSLKSVCFRCRNGNLHHVTVQYGLSGRWIWSLRGIVSRISCEGESRTRQEHL